MAALVASPLTKACMEMAASNDFSRLDSNAAKRHHFVPQLLLRRFAEAHSGKDCLFQMEATSRKAPLRVDMRTAASRRRLYTALGEDGQPSNRIEGYLALIETHAAPALRHLIEDPGSLSPGQRATIAFFVGVQTMRTPAAAEQITMLANAALQRAASEFYSDRDAFADRHREFFDDGATPAEIEEFRVKTLDQIRQGQVQVSGDDGAAFATAIEHAIRNAPTLFTFDWTLLCAPDGGLITSDRGYAIHDPTPPYPWAGQGLLSSENSETSMPLSDTSSLLMRPGPGRSTLAVREISASEVQRLNLRIYGWADKYVFARKQTTLVDTRVASRRRAVDVVRPKPFCEVTLLEPDPTDDSLAKANVRRGWPPQLRNESGELRDYIVTPTDEPHPELRQLADDLVERRARKRAGIDPDTPISGRITYHRVHPLGVQA